MVHKTRSQLMVDKFWANCSWLFTYITISRNKKNNLNWSDEIASCELSVRPRRQLRACLHGGGGPQVGEVTRLASRGRKTARVYMQIYNCQGPGEVTRGCCVVAKHVNRENGGRTTHLSVVVFSSHLLLSLQHFSAVSFFFVYFIDAKPPPKAVNCSGNAAVRPRQCGLPHLETFTCQNATPAEKVTLPGRPGNPPRRVIPSIM